MQSTDHLALPWPFCKQTKTSQQQNETQIKMSIFSVNSCCAYLQYIIVTHTSSSCIHTHVEMYIIYCTGFYAIMSICACASAMNLLQPCCLLALCFTFLLVTRLHTYIHIYLSTYLHMCV